MREFLKSGQDAKNLMKDRQVCISGGGTPSTSTNKEYWSGNILWAILLQISTSELQTNQN